MDLRKLIVEWIKANGVHQYWLLAIYHHLINRHGASGDDAIRAMNDFVGEAIDAKSKRKVELVE